MVVQYVLIAFVAFVASMDEQLFGITMLGRPLFTSLFVGIILGDVQQGVIVGAALESMFMGAIMVGAAVPPEVYASGVLGCAFAIITGTGTAAAVALALPVSVFLQVWRNFCYAVPGAFACKRIEAAIEQRDLKKANLLHLTIVPLSIGIPSALLVFCSLFFGADLINNALNMIPQFVMDGLNVASGVMVCIGFALLICTMGDNKLLPWLFLGFIMVIYLGMDVVGVAAAAICIALIQAFNAQPAHTQGAAIEEEEDF
jgi:fructoselysine and glucoselysine-specific PTS system IIC component